MKTSHSVWWLHRRCIIRSQIKMRNCAGERAAESSKFSEHNPVPRSSQGNHKFSAARIIEFSAHERVLRSAIKDILLSLSRECRDAFYIFTSNTTRALPAAWFDIPAWVKSSWWIRWQWRLICYRGADEISTQPISHPASSEKNNRVTHSCKWISAAQ